MSCAFRRTLLLAATLPFGVGVGAESPTCADVAAFVEARIPDGSKDRVGSLVTCTPWTAAAALESAKRIASAWARLERQQADAAAQLGDPSSAITHLQAAVRLDPKSVEAIAALTAQRRALVAQFLAEADASLTLGKVDEAIARLNEARKVDPRDPQVGRFEAKLTATGVARYRGLLASGKLDDALGQLVSLSESRPEISVENIIRETPELRWRVLQNRIERWGIYAGQWLVFATLVLWLSYRVSRRYSSKPLLEIADFENTDQAKGIERAIQATLRNLSQGGGRAASNLQHVSRPIEDAKLPVELSSAVPASWGWANFIPALASFVIPPKKVQIRGVLLHDTQRGAGISAEVRLANGRGFGETFWATDYIGPAKPAADDKSGATHHDLVESVAIWLLFRLSGGPLTMLGTRNWQSYAYFRAGVRAEARKDDGVAKSHYLKALELDDQIHAARLNLAKLASGHEQSSILGLLRRALQADRSDATRYQARYTLAIRQFDETTPDTAIAEAEALFKDIAETAWEYGLYGVYSRVQQEVPSHTLPRWQQPRRGWLFLRHSILTSRFARSPSGTLLARLQQRRRHRKLERYLENVLPVTLTMWVGVTLAKAPAHAGALATMRRLDGIDHSPMLLYNLACVESIRAAHIQKPDERHDCLKRSLDKLRLALWMKPDIGRRVRRDTSLVYLRSSAELINGTKCSEAFESLVASLVPDALAADGKHA